jgi:hypothetical protein
VIVLGVPGILLNLLEILGGLSESSGFFISITNARTINVVKTHFISTLKKKSMGLNLRFSHLISTATPF